MSRQNTLTHHAACPRQTGTSGWFYLGGGQEHPSTCFQRAINRHTAQIKVTWKHLSECHRNYWPNTDFLHEKLEADSRVFTVGKGREAREVSLSGGRHHSIKRGSFVGSSPAQHFYRTHCSIGFHARNIDQDSHFTQLLAQIVLRRIPRSPDRQELSSCYTLPGNPSSTSGHEGMRATEQTW